MKLLRGKEPVCQDFNRNCSGTLMVPIVRVTLLPQLVHLLVSED